MNEFKTYQMGHFQLGPFCSLTNFCCLNIQRGISLHIKDLTPQNSHTIDISLRPFQHAQCCSGNPHVDGDIQV